MVVGSGHGDVPKYAGEGVALHGTPGALGVLLPHYSYLSMAILGNFGWAHFRHSIKGPPRPRLGVLACCSSICQVQLYHQRPTWGWYLTHVGCNMSPGWSLLPLTVIIVLAFVNMLCPQRGPLSISTRPGSAALLPVSTTSTGLLRLLVGACVHRVRSNTGKCRVWLLPRAHHFQCVTHVQSNSFSSFIFHSKFTKHKITISVSEHKNDALALIIKI